LARFRRYYYGGKMKPTMSDHEKNVLDEFATELNDKYKILDWPEILGKVIELALEKLEPTTNDYKEMLYILSDDLRYRATFLEWPNYEE
jgi:hypothetical protein